MAYVPVSFWLGGPGISKVGNALTFTSTAISASAHLVAWSGYYWNADRSTKSITKVGFLCGTVTPNSSTMKISLQDVHATAGPPAQPDGTADQSVTFADTALTTDTWYQTAALSASRSLAFGELVSVVLEFDTFGAGTVVNVKNLLLSNTFQKNNNNFSLNTAGTWSQQTVVPNIILEDTGGGFGGLGAWPATMVCEDAAALSTLNTTSSPDEVALKFTVTAKMKMDGLYIFGGTTLASRDFEFNLYNDTTPVGSALSVISEQQTGYASIFHFAAEKELLPGNTYYLAIKPTTTSNISCYYFDVNAAGHWEAWPGEASDAWGYREDAGAWSATTTRRPAIGIHISAIDDGAGGGARVIGN